MEARARMFIAGFSLVLAFVSICFPFSTNVFAFPDENPQRNWMREYVQLRTKAQLEKLQALQKNTIPLMAPKIVGGTLAPTSLHGFQVGLLNKSMKNDFDAQYCGGTLISSQHIVTAAHCSDFISASQVAVLVGTQTLKTRGAGNRIAVTAVRIYPTWFSNSNDSFDNDIAVWKLAKRVTNIKPATLAAFNSDPSGYGTVTGWGTTAYGVNSYPTKLRSVSVPIVNRTSCSLSYSNEITDSMFCAGEAGKDSCQGDSGGPITQDPTNTTLIGVVSWGNGCGLASYPGVYTRIGNQNVYNFITQAITY